MEVMEMADKVQRDRLNAYVEPITTKTIQEVKEQYQKELGVKLTIGQAVDIMAKQYRENKGS